MGLSDYDRELLERCLSRQPSAWNQFVDRFVGLVLHVIRHSARARGIPLQKDDEEDIAAEIFFAFVDEDYAILRRFRGEAALATYLTVVARRIAVRELLQSKALLRSVGTHDEPPQAGGDRPPSANGHDPPDAAAEDDIRRWENRHDVERALSRMNGTDAQLLRDYHLEGKSYRQIADEFGVPENSVGPMLSRARQRAATLLPGDA